MTEELTREELELFREEEKEIIPIANTDNKDEALLLFRGYKEYIKATLEEERARRINIKIIPFSQWRKKQNDR